MTGACGSQSTSLTCAEDYFLKVLKTNKESFFGQPSTFAFLVQCRSMGFLSFVMTSKKFLAARPRS
jgi:hypothetical protein